MRFSVKIKPLAAVLLAAAMLLCPVRGLAPLPTASAEAFTYRRYTAPDRLYIYDTSGAV